MHTRDLTILHTHCGLCSQCIGRRFATLASRFADDDPAEMYKVDLLTGERKPGVDVTMLESTIAMARDMESMTDGQFFPNFGEASRVLRHLPGTADEVATHVWGIHKRYGSEVGGVLTKAIADHALEIREGRLPNTSAIILALPENYKKAPGKVTASPGLTPQVGEARANDNGSPEAAEVSATARLAKMPGSSRRRMPRSIGTQAAVDAVIAYMQKNGLNQTQFAGVAHTNERTIRKFFNTGKLRTSTFEDMAIAMGTTKADLLQGKLNKN